MTAGPVGYALVTYDISETEKCERIEGMLIHGIAFSEHGETRDS